MRAPLTRGHRCFSMNDVNHESVARKSWKHERFGEASTMISLALSREAYLEGRLDSATELARRQVVLAAEDRNPLLEAEARLLAAQCLVARGRVTPAMTESRRALHLFESAQSRDGEFRSLVALSYAATNLAANELSLMAADHASQIAATSRQVAQEAVAHHYMGIAMFWAAGQGETADRHLRSALEMSRLGPNADADLYPILNLAAAEIVSTLYGRALNGVVPDPAPLASILKMLGSRDLARAAPFYSSTAHSDGQAITALLRAFEAIWRGELRAARELLDFFAARLHSASVSIDWLRPYLPLAVHELAVARRDWKTAVLESEQSVTGAMRMENVALARLARTLQLRDLEAMGRTDDALRGWRALYRESQQRLTVPGQGLRMTVKTVADDTPVRKADPLSGSIERWQRKYSLTWAETDVLRSLCRGDQPAAIAEARQTRIGTVRTQMRLLFDKTGFHSQRALLAAVMNDSIDDVH